MKQLRLFLVLGIAVCMQSSMVCAGEREYSWQIWKKKRDKDNQGFIERFREVHYAEPHNKDKAEKALEEYNTKKLAEEYFPEGKDDKQAYWWLSDDSDY